MVLVSLSETFGLPLHNTPHMEIPLPHTLLKTREGYEVRYKTHRVEIQGLPSLESYSELDIMVLLDFIRQKHDLQEKAMKDAKDQPRKPIREHPKLL